MLTMHAISNFWNVFLLFFLYMIYGEVKYYYIDYFTKFDLKLFLFYKNLMFDFYTRENLPYKTTFLL